MDREAQKVIIETFKEEGIELIVTLPEEPTYSLTEEIRQDPYFTAITVAGEGNGIALTAGASLGGRKAVFVTGIAGMLVGTWALSNMSTMLYSVPFLIIASYRGDFGDKSGIPGSTLWQFNQVGEPLLHALRIPYRVIRQKAELKRTLKDAIFSCWEYNTPVVLLLAGEVLWNGEVMP